MSLVTITRNIGCGGTTIARLVDDGLKLELYDDYRLQEEAIKMGISPEVLKRLDEKAPGLFNRLLRSHPGTRQPDASPGFRMRLARAHSRLRALPHPASHASARRESGGG